MRNLAKSELKLALVFLALITFQLVWHWLLTWHNGASEAGLQLYLSHNEHSRKGLAGYVDLVVPGAFIGIIIGRIGWQWNLGKHAIAVLVCAAALVALRPLYVEIMRPETLWWWPNSKDQVMSFLIGNSIGTTVLLAVCVYGGRIWRTEGRS